MALIFEIFHVPHFSSFSFCLTLCLLKFPEIIKFPRKSKREMLYYCNALVRFATKRVQFYSKPGCYSGNNLLPDNDALCLEK